MVSYVAALPGEKGLNRMYFLADLLQRKGFEVDFITSNFQHWEKKQRDTNIDTSNFRCKVTFMQQPSYTKNIEVKRIISYRILANNIKKHLGKNKYDLIYCSIPDNHTSAICVKYAKKHNIPAVIDIEDLWPEAMKMKLDIPIITDIPYSYFSHDAKITYKNCDAVVGSSDTYRDEPEKYGISVPRKITVYVGTDLSVFDESVERYSREVDKPENEFWVTYAGTLGSSYDIGTLVESADIIKKKTDNIKIKILGDGPLREAFENKARTLSGNVDFLGYQPYQKMAAFLSKSDITVNSIVHGAAQSIVSKIGDYLAAGAAMINTCEDPEFWQKVETDGFGLNVRPGDAEALAKCILYLFENKDVLTEMAEKARKIGEQQFDRNTSYLKIVDLISDLLNH